MANVALFLALIGAARIESGVVGLVAPASMETARHVCCAQMAQHEPVRSLRSVLPALRLRGGGFGAGARSEDPNIGGMAGDISYQSDGDGGGIDPYDSQEERPDSFPDNPESLEGRDVSETIVIDANEQAQLAKEGSPGPDNLEARDEYHNDKEVMPETDLLQLLTTSRPSGIVVKSRCKKARDADEFDVRGPTYHLAQTGREFLEEYPATFDGLTAEHVMDEIRRDEAKQDRKAARKANAGLSSPGDEEASTEQPDALSAAGEDGGESDCMMEAASNDTHQDASGHAGIEESGLDTWGAGQGGGLHVSGAGSEAGSGGDQGLVPGARVKFANEEGGVCYGVIRAFPEKQGGEGQEQGRGRAAGRASTCDDHVYVDCIDATSVTEIRKVPRALLKLVQTGYLSASSASAAAARKIRRQGVGGGNEARAVMQRGQGARKQTAADATSPSPHGAAPVEGRSSQRATSACGAVPSALKDAGARADAGDKAAPDAQQLASRVSLSVKENAAQASTSQCVAARPLAPCVCVSLSLSPSLSPSLSLSPSPSLSVSVSVSSMASLALPRGVAHLPLH